MQKISKENGSVFCGKEAWATFNSKLSELDPSKVFVITDTHTKQHCTSNFQKNYSYSITPCFLEMPAGESNKTIEQCIPLWESLSELGAD